VYSYDAQNNVLTLTAKMPGSLARTCNVATDRLGQRDARGLSAIDPRPRLRIRVRIKLNDVDTLS